MSYGNYERAIAQAVADELQARGIGSGGGVSSGGDASAVNQTAQIALETAIRDRLPTALIGGRLAVDSSGVTQPVSIASLPLNTITSATAGSIAPDSTGNIKINSNSNRKKLTIHNVGSNPAYCFEGVVGTFGTGIYLPPNGGGYQWDSLGLFTGDIFFITATGLTTTISFSEGV